MTCVHAFSRAWHGRHAFASSSDWFIGLFTTVVIGQSNIFGFGFTTLKWNPLYTLYTSVTGELTRVHITLVCKNSFFWRFKDSQRLGTVWQNRFISLCLFQSALYRIARSRSVLVHPHVTSVTAVSWEYKRLLVLPVHLNVLRHIRTSEERALKVC